MTFFFSIARTAGTEEFPIKRDVIIFGPCNQPGDWESYPGYEKEKMETYVDDLIERDDRDKSEDVDAFRTKSKQEEQDCEGY